MPYLPEPIINKISLYLSHPVAELIKTSVMFRARKYKSECVHGCPYDRGCADAYYSRDIDPHYGTNGNGLNGGRVEMLNMSAAEIEAYMLGYISERERKWKYVGMLNDYETCLFCEKPNEKMFPVCSVKCLMKAEKSFYIPLLVAQDNHHTKNHYERCYHD